MEESKKHDQAKVAVLLPSMVVWVESGFVSQSLTMVVTMPQQKIRWTTGELLLSSPDPQPP
jgi:hypothetical protein